MTDFDLISFASEFVLIARRDSYEAPYIKQTLFTSRQSQAIASLGTSRILRTKKALSVSNLVTLAVITSPPEAQKYAEMIALRVLLGDERELFSESPAPILKSDKVKLQQQLSAQDLILQDVLDFLKLEKSVNMVDERKFIKFMESFENNIFGDNNQGKTVKQNIQLQMQREEYAIMGGRKGILNNQLSSSNDISNYVKNKIMRSVTSISDKELIQAEFLGYSNDIKELSRENLVKSLSELLSGSSSLENNGFSKRGIEIIDSFSKREAARALRLLNDYNSFLQRSQIDPKAHTPSLNSLIKGLEGKIIDNANNLDDIISHPHLFKDNLDFETIENLIEETKKYSSGFELLKKGKEIDDYLSTNIASNIYDRYKDEFDQMELEKILRNQIPSSEWLDSLNRSMKDYNGNTTFLERMGLLRELRQSKEGSKNISINKKLTEHAKIQVNKALLQSSTGDELTELVEFTKNNGYQISSDKIRTKGIELGMTSTEISKLIGDVYEHLKLLIQNDDPGFERVNGLLKHASLSDDEFNSLIQISVKSKSTGGMGALANQDLQKVAKQLPSDPDSKELFEQAIGAGDGENLLQQWFLHGRTLPKWMKEIVKKTAKKVMIDLAKAKANALIGSSEAGPLPEGSTRPYMLGDEPDTIDLDETIDNILFLGKKIEDVTAEDFIVRKTVTGRRCVIFLVDISGSMTGKPIASASLATVMLLFAFARDELGIALFESNTHVVCEINKKLDMDLVVDEILDLEARGGTQMQAALEWAENQFKLSSSQDKMFCMLTDAMIGDFNRSFKHMRNIADQGASSVLIVPDSMYGMGNIQSIIENANAKLITVKDWKDFPEIVSKVLSRG